MNYKSFNLGDWIGHISGVIEDETTLDGNEMRDLVEFLTSLNQEPCEDAISRKAIMSRIESEYNEWGEDYDVGQILGDIEDFPSVYPKARQKVRRERNEIYK